MSWKWGSVLLTAGLFAASSGQLERATQECWGKLNGKAQVEWYGHLRTIDESDRAEAVRTSTARSMAHCVTTDTGSPRHDQGVWRIVEAFVKQQFRVPDTQ